MIEIKPKLLKEITELTSISLNINQIELLSPDLFVYNKHLEIINLADNNIKELPERLFSGLNELIVIDFESNNITSLPSMEIESRLLVLVDFSQNPISKISLQFIKYLDDWKSLKVSCNGEEILKPCIDEFHRTELKYGKKIYYSLLEQIA